MPHLLLLGWPKHSCWPPPDFFVLCPGHITRMFVVNGDGDGGGVGIGKTGIGLGWRWGRHVCCTFCISFDVVFGVGFSCYSAGSVAKKPGMATVVEMVVAMEMVMGVAMETVPVVVMAMSMMIGN